MTQPRSGLFMGAGAYFLWGLFPLYWPLLAPASAVEALAHRFVWSLAFVVLLLALTRRWAHFRAIWSDRRRVGFLAIASVVIALNWGFFIWGVTHGHVIETSLGYFINPLVTVMLGVFVLGEALRPWQWAAVGFGAVAVAVLTVDYGRPPWIALVLAGSFATYGFLKKQARLGAVESLGAETLILAPVALAFLVWLDVTGRATFGHAGLPNALLLAGTGVVTAIPLLLFGGAATRLSLTTLGILQYLGPALQFVFGLTIFHEPMSNAAWVGFVLVWVALAIFTVDGVRHHRRVPLAVA
ncbi:MAG TPA: EamA family transporter RarD [Aeromicrobium sp.]|nr:EamA family transporter RarD [Aeromicrobium sp.]